MSDQQNKLLPGGYVHLLFIIQWVVELHIEQIQEAARGNLAPGIGAPGEDEAIESVLRIFEARYLEADRRLIERYMAARTWKWWREYPERRLLSDLVERADRRKGHWAGPEDQRRCPTHSEGLRIARPLLAALPKKISLDAVGEYESVARLLAAVMLPPMGEPTSEELQRYTRFAESIPVYKDGVRYFYAGLDNATVPLYRPDIGWQRRSGIRHYRRKVKVRPGGPVRPAIFLRNLQVQFVVGLLDRIGISPRGEDVSGILIVSEALGIPEGTIRRMWDMGFPAEMKKQSRAVAERLGLLDTTEG